jgi:hypothetical protein
MAGLALSFLLKMSVTMAVVLAAARVARLAGPFIASIVMSLPVTAGPGFFFLSLAEPPDFVAEGAMFGLATVGGTIVYSIIFVEASRRFGFALSLALAIGGWTAVSVLVRALPVSLPLALASGALGAMLSWLMRRPHDFAGLPPAARGQRWHLWLRGAVAGLAVAAIATLGDWLGPALAGMALGFPTAYTATAWVMNASFGLRFAAAVMASTQVGIFIYASFCLALNLLAGALPGPAAVLAAVVAAAAVAATIAATFQLRHGRSVS